ncbi:MAG: hypothetical protein KDB88_10035 [Flavobacteriales bacterium]|nr:hypothetical protein [Flavobacteriales bacterium]
MKKTRTGSETLVVTCSLLVLTACSGSRTASYAPDDVYGIERGELALTGAGSDEDLDRTTNTEDYYDAGEAEAYRVDKNYYDVTYNDPQYFNYGRFGFNAGISTWGSGMGVGYQWGSPGFYDPYWNNSYMSGYGAWGSPYYGMGWGSGFGMGWSVGMGMGSWNAWNPGWYGGYGPYYGPWGNCFSCYQPVVIGDGFGNTPIVRHRTGFNNAPNGGQGQVYMPPYDPAGLLPDRRQLSRSGSYEHQAVQRQRSSGMNTGERPGSVPSQSFDRGSRSSGSFGGGSMPSRSAPMGGGGGRSISGGRR